MNTNNQITSKPSNGQILERGYTPTTGDLTRPPKAESKDTTDKKK